MPARAERRKPTACVIFILAVLSANTIEIPLEADTKTNPGGRGVVDVHETRACGANANAQAAHVDGSPWNELRSRCSRIRCTLLIDADPMLPRNRHRRRRSFLFANLVSYDRCGVGMRLLYFGEGIDPFIKQSCRLGELGKFGDGPHLKLGGDGRAVKLHGALV